MDDESPFSVRFGFEQRRNVMQLDGLDPGTRVRLWNTLREHLSVRQGGWGGASAAYSNQGFQTVMIVYYDRVLRRSRTEVVQSTPYDILTALEGLICSDLEWHRVFDSLEFFARLEGAVLVQYGEATVKPGLQEWTNQVLAQELVGYRFVDAKLVPVTNDGEIAELATSTKSSVPTVADHFRTAMSLLADRSASDLAPAVASAVNGVEAAAKFITGKDSAVLTSMLQTLEGQHGVHPQLTDVFKKMYNWTSDAGIRHGKKAGDVPVDRDLAKCIVVMCSAFANLLVSSKSS